MLLLCQGLLSLLLIFASTQTLGQSTVVGQGLIDAELRRSYENPDGEVSIEIAAPRAFVFDFMINRASEFIERANAMSFDHDKAEQPGVMGVGSERTLSMDEDAMLLQRFLTYEPPARYAYHVDMASSTLDIPLDYSISRYQLSDTDSGGTHLEVAVVYESNIKLLGFVVRRAFRSALREEFERAAAIIASEYKAQQISAD